MPDRYQFSFSWHSVYGHAVRLIEDLGLKTGVVLDLGCGHGAVAEPLAERGYTYVGTDIDRSALGGLDERGFETHELDMSEVDQLVERVVKAVDGRPVSAVLMLDVIEHQHPTPPLLAAVAAALDEIGKPPLVVSVPNITHVDVASKLLFGRWDYTPTGLLDDTHVSFFTGGRLTAEMRAAGLLQLASNDFVLPKSDQHFPLSLPVLQADNPIGQLLHAWRTQCDDDGLTNQFVRAFTVAPVASEPFAEPAVATRFLTVIMRTQGRRRQTLREALTCLAAQTDDDFDVLLLVHTDDLDVTEEVEALVGEFHATFADRVAVVSVHGGGRSRPLNVGLEQLHNDYVAFLDDDDLVTANWVEAFKSAADGHTVVRSMTVEQQVSAALEHENVPYHLESGLRDRWVVPFDLGQHFWQNHTPICSFAVPRSVIDVFRLRFDETLPVVEDWHFLMRAAMVAGVRDTGEITSIYRRWQRGESSTSLHDEELWSAMHRSIVDRFDDTPIVMPIGSASHLSELWGLLDVSQHESHIVRVQNDMLRARLEALERSRWWRATRPPARIVDWFKGRVRSSKWIRP